VGARSELGADPLAADALLDLVPDLGELDAYVCGPTGMIAATVTALAEAGVARRHIHAESFEF
jgi:ferredoxin-NADP reductase